MSVTSATHQLDVLIAAPIERVWTAIADECSVWWPKEFVTSERTKRFVIEASLGGRVFEDFGNGHGLVWYTVVGIDEHRSLTLAGHLIPPFGGPAVTSLTLTLTSHRDGTLLSIRDDRFGVLSTDSPLEGWKTVFDLGLKRYLEAA